MRLNVGYINPSFTNGLLRLLRGRWWCENWFLVQQRGWWMHIWRILLKFRWLFRDIFRSKFISHRLLLLWYFYRGGMKSTPRIHALVSIVLILLKTGRIFFFVLGGLWWQHKFRIFILFFFTRQLWKAFLGAERWLSITNCPKVFRPSNIACYIFFTRFKDMWRSLLI